MRLINSLVFRGLLATLILLGVYFLIVSLISGWSFAVGQFSRFWYFIASLAIGFGVQVGLYSYLKKLIHNGNTSGRVVAVAGTTSTASMISCCAHYLANVIPILSATGLATVVSQYQVRFFWVGIVFNFAGIGYISSQINKYSRHAEV